MFEKYDVTACGASGGGGEYISQVSAGCNFGICVPETYLSFKESRTHKLKILPST